MQTRGRRAAWILGGLTFVLLLALLLFRSEFLTHYHLRRLEAKPEYLRAIALSEPETPADRAIHRYLSEANGRAALLRQVLELMLESLRDPKRATAVLDLPQWHSVILNLDQIEPKSTSADWWVTYTGTSMSPSTQSKGSASAPASLVSLYRRLVALDSIAEVLRYDLHPEFVVGVRRPAKDRVSFRLSPKSGEE